MLSIWEKQHFVSYDYIIIGSGIVGMSTAYYIKQAAPQATVLILERGLLPSGASTKNAGFACMGSVTELLADLASMPEETVWELFLQRKNGLERLRKILGDEHMNYQSSGSYELILDHTDYTQQIAYINQKLYPHIKQEAFTLLLPHQWRSFGLAGVQAVIQNNCEGEIDTGKTMRYFRDMLSAQGVTFITGCKVEQLLETDTSVEVACFNPVDQQPITFIGKHVSICTNAFAKTLLPEADVTPGRGQVLVTKPISDLSVRGIFHFEQGYYYCRNFQNRILLGGGRNMDVKGETTTEFGLHEAIQQNLIHKLKTIILPDKHFEIDMQWSGIMAFGPEKKPIIQSYSQRIAVGVRMGGMGVAIGSEVGFTVAQLAINSFN